MNVSFMRDMYKSVDLNSVADHVKTIFDSSRCNVCDKHDGLRLRYICGHTSCEECAQFGSCSLCLTPPGPDSSKPVVDKPLTQRADNARRLLDSFQEYFNFDVVKRQRLSEQLKVEKELFPQCIQAPSKYYNKRKSYQSPKTNKENKSISLPGQEISRTDLKMENSNKNVHEWLNKYVKRKPFSELDPNQTLWRSKKQKTHSISSMFTESKAQKTYSGISKKRKSTSNTSVEKSKISKILKSKNVNDESGIVLDDDDDELDEEAVIVIDDSQNVVDKDKEALLAVEQAENNIKKYSQSIGTTFCNSTSQDETKKLLNEKTTANEKYTDNVKDVILNENNDVTTTNISKVPFYKKAYLTETCKYCKEATNIHSKQFEDLSFTIDSDSFITVIKVSQIDNYLINKQSIQVQTDTTENNNITKKKIAGTAIEFNINTKNSAVTGIESNFDTKKTAATAIENTINTKNTESTSIKSKIDEMKVNTLPLKQDLLKGFEKEGDSKKLVNKNENVIIEESDTDSDVDLEASISLEVKAEVHRSCDQMDYNILNNVENIEEHSKRPRRAARGNTPNSTDSSDKENYNPNRMRKTNNSTKKKSKK